MELKKRKIKYSAIFCLCWFAFLVFLVSTYNRKGSTNYINDETSEYK